MFCFKDIDRGSWIADNDIDQTAFCANSSAEYDYDIIWRLETADCDIVPSILCLIISHYVLLYTNEEMLPQIWGEINGSLTSPLAAVKYMISTWPSLDLFKAHMFHARGRIWSLSIYTFVDSASRSAVFRQVILVSYHVCMCGSSVPLALAAATHTKTLGYLCVMRWSIARRNQ